MAAAEYDFTIEQGATFPLICTYKDDTGAAQDLTGFTARMQIRENLSATAVLLELNTENGRINIEGADGRVELLLTADETAAITWKRGVYDLEIESPDGEVKRLLKGRITVDREVTR